MKKFMYGLPQFMYNADLGGDLGNGGTGDGKVQENGAINEDTTSTNDKPLTLEDVQKMIQSETDKVRGEYSKKLKDKDKELEEVRLSSMTEDEKKAEMLKNATTELEKKQAELLHKELTLGTIDLLKENDLPLDAKDFLLGKDLESTKANVEAFKNMFATALEQAVTERFKQTGKEHVEGGSPKGRYTQADVAKMSPDEINANWEKIQRDLTAN